MSLWKCGNFETDIDFTDADFLDALQEAKIRLEKESSEVPVVGKQADIIRAQILCFDHFFDTIFGTDAGALIRENKWSLEKSLDAVESLNSFYDKEDDRVSKKYSHYQVQNHGNRQQIRAYNKKHNSNYSRR